MKFLRWLGPPLIFFALLLCGLEALVRLEILPSFLFPSPSQVIAALIENQQELTSAFFLTARATASGFLLSFLIAQSLALVLALLPWLRRSIFPIAVFFQTVPIIAIAPLLVIWFGFGEPTVRASSAIVSFFPILSNALVGLESVRFELKELFRVLGASRWQTLVKLQIPSSLRSTFAGLRVAAGLAVVGALVGEFVGGGGLGSIVDSARTQQRVDLVFASVVLASLLGLVFVGFVIFMEKMFQLWRPYFQDVD